MLVKDFSAKVDFPNMGKPAILLALWAASAFAASDEAAIQSTFAKPFVEALRANDRAIKAQEHAEVKANGGHLTKAEQRQLNREENANSKLIRDEKHPAGK